MTVSYSLAPIPKWYIADLTGKPLGAGYMYTYSSLNKALPKPVYQDPNGSLAWSNPVRFDENGSQGPFYWSFDTTAPTDLYYIEIYDRNGVLQWTIDNYDAPGSGGGGGGSTFTALKNYVVNGQFWRNIGTSITPLPIYLAIAPGAHESFVGNTSNSNGNTAPDITFIKSNTVASDQLIFTPFALGSNVLTGDVTPQYYLNYQSNAAPGETFKCVQVPIVAKVQNLSNTAMTIVLAARTNSGTPSLQLYWRQFYGDGTAPAASPEQRIFITTLNLTGTWTQYTINTTTPNPSGLTIGSCNNDALYLQIQYPLTTACNIDMTKIELYLGANNPTQDFDTYDQTDAIINSARTGDVRIGLNNFNSFGWVSMNDGTIGSAASGATTRANADTFPLYDTIWNNVLDAWAPVSTGRGASSITDFSANKTITLTRVLGRALAGQGSGSGLTARVLGEYVGSETHTLTIGELASHNHSNTGNFVNNNNAGGPFTLGGSGGTNATTNSTGSNTPFNIMQPTSFMNVFIKL